MIAALGWRLLRSLVHPRIESGRQSFFEAFSLTAADTVFFGDSITANGEWEELFPGARIRNRGIGGDETGDLGKRIQTVIDARPERLFVQVGTNDLANGIPLEMIVGNYRALLQRVVCESPATSLHVQSVFPRAASYRGRVEALNREIERLCDELELNFIDLYPHFLGEDGGIRQGLHTDGLHLSGAGYRLWQKLLTPYLDESSIRE